MNRIYCGNNNYKYLKLSGRYNILKFKYADNLYLFGAFICLLIGSYGVYFIFSLKLSSSFYLIKLFYFAYMYLILDWYYEQYNKYKQRYVIVSGNGIKIVNKEFETFLEKEEIDCIIVARHHQLLKIHNVVHIFTKEGDYFFFTNEINKYSKFKKQLQDNFRNKFIVTTKLVKKSHNITKEFLLLHE